MSDNSVISTRVRLARNLKDFPFPCKLSPDGMEKVIEKVRSAVKNSNSSIASDFKFIKMSDLTEAQCVSLVERRIVSPEFISNTEGRALLVNSDESLSIMINEEDHIRIQAITKGLALEQTYDLVDKLDTLLDESLDFAFSEKLGYLTQCPTNLGTGMRASVMLHLPVTESNGEIAAVSDTVGKIGFTVRGMYGEGSKSAAAMYQVSNQITLGISEKNAVDNLKIITGQLIAKERESRAALDRIKAEDICGRAYGILTNCRLLSSEEMMKLLSAIKLGIGMGILDIKADPVKLIIEGQPHMLMKRYGTMNAQERDICRAGFIKEQLTKV